MKQWISRVPREKRELHCPACGDVIENCDSFIDHHLHPCRKCAKRTFHWCGDREYITVCLDHAPNHVEAFLQWANDSLDELQFLQLMLSLVDIFDDMRPASAPRDE